MKGKKGVEIAWNYVASLLIGIAVLIFFLVFYTKIGQELKEAIRNFFQGLFGL